MCVNHVNGFVPTLLLYHYNCVAMTVTDRTAALVPMDMVNGNATEGGAPPYARLLAVAPAGRPALFPTGRQGSPA